MRQLSELIEEAKFNANVDKSNKFTDTAMVRLFDTAQRQIQMVIHNAYPQDAIFGDCKTYDKNDENKYKLPLSKMLTPNSIHAVINLSDTGNYSEPLPRIAVWERQRERGYYLIDNFLYVSASLSRAGSSGGLELIYAKLLPRLTTTTQVSDLPTICEEYMVQWVERKIHYIQSNRDVNNSQVFTAQQRQDIINLFADAARDVKQPGTANDEYLAY